MRLKSAARYFDDTPVYDAYTGEFLWMCQFSSFNDANAVGSTSTRRILSIAPDLELPPRRVVKVFNDNWLVGDGNPDSWKGEQIRQSFNMKKATDYPEILTPAQACLGTAGVKAYSQRIYFKDTVNTLNDGDYDAFWNFFFAPAEPLVRGSFIRAGADLFRARNTYVPLEDLRIAQSDAVDRGPVAASFDAGVYAPLTDSFSVVPTATTILVFDVPKAYSRLTMASLKAEPGDVGALAAQSAVTPVVGRTVTFDGTAWRILAKDAEGDAWLLHLRRA